MTELKLFCAPKLLKWIGLGKDMKIIADSEFVRILSLVKKNAFLQTCKYTQGFAGNFEEYYACELGEICTRIRGSVWLEPGIFSIPNGIKIKSELKGRR